MLDAAGFDVVLLETVGTGQSEVEVAAAADTTVVLEAPEMGDEVQAIKAGLLEVADIVVVNKGDRPGAQRTAAQLRAMLVPTVARERLPTRPPGAQAAGGARDDGSDRGGDPGAARGARPAPGGGRRRRRRARPARPARRRRSVPSSSSGCGSGSRRRAARAAGTDAAIAAVAGHELDPYAAADELLAAVARSRATMSVERVFVAGAGLMGHGIAQVHAAVGKHVALYEPDLARAVAGRDRIAGNLERAVAKGKLTPEDRDATLARLEPDRTTSRAAADADLVVEAVFEDVDVKTRLWAELDRDRARRRDLRLQHLVDRHRPAGRRGRRGAARPVRRDALLQPGAGDAAHRAHPRRRRPTTPPRRQSAALAAELGKQVIVSADRPGFIVNRILMPFLAEAMRAY